MQAIATPNNGAPKAGRIYRTPRSTRAFPAVLGIMGPRLLTYATQISPYDIEDVLGHDPRSDRHGQLADVEIKRIYAHVQRKTTKARRDAIVDYLRHQLFDGLIAAGFPAISIAIQNPIRFEDAGGDGGLGQMILETGRNNRRIVLDGLARISGTLALVDMAMGDSGLDPAERDRVRKMLDQFTLPVVFYAPRAGEPQLDVDDLGQLFHDFNFRATPVAAKDAIALDRSDLHVQATYRLCEDVHAIRDNGGMDTRAASLGINSDAIVVQPVLLRFVRAALEGEASVEASRKSRIGTPRLTHQTRQRLLSDLSDFLDNVATAMGERWAVRDSLHLSSAGWTAIGVIYHDVTVRLSDVDLLKFAKALGQLDWSRNAPMWAPLVTDRAKADGTEHKVLQGAGATARRQMVRILREHFKLAERLHASASVAAPKG